MVDAVAVQQITLRQRSLQVCDANIQGANVLAGGLRLAGGVRADLTVFGHSDDANDNRGKHEHRSYDQPSPGRS